MPETSTAFVSYSREDSEFVLKLSQDLRDCGASVWLDQLDIEPGREWDSAIEEAVAQCRRMLVVLSPASVKSRNVRNELAVALDKRNIIIPVLYRDCAIPLQIRRIQYTDFRTDYGRALKMLLKALGGKQPPDWRETSKAKPRSAIIKILLAAFGVLVIAYALSWIGRHKNVTSSPSSGAGLHNSAPAQNPGPEKGRRKQIRP